MVYIAGSVATPVIAASASILCSNGRGPLATSTTTASASICINQWQPSRLNSPRAAVTLCQLLCKPALTMLVRKRVKLLSCATAQLALCSMPASSSRDRDTATVKTQIAFDGLEGCQTTVELGVMEEEAILVLVH